MRHRYLWVDPSAEHLVASNMTICGVFNPKHDNGNGKDCLRCDRILRDKYRAQKNMPPLTDKEFWAIHKRPTGKVLVVNGGRK